MVQATAARPTPAPFEIRTHWYAPAMVKTSCKREVIVPPSRRRDSRSPRRLRRPWNSIHPAIRPQRATSLRLPDARIPGCLQPAVTRIKQKAARGERAARTGRVGPSMLYTMDPNRRQGGQVRRNRAALSGAVRDVLSTPGRCPPCGGRQICARSARYSSASSRSLPRTTRRPRGRRRDQRGEWRRPRRRTIGAGRAPVPL